MAALPRLLVCAALGCAALVLGNGSPALAAAPCADATLSPLRENLERVRAATLCLLNAERDRRDLAPLRANEQLDAAADRYSTKMVRERFFDHVCPEGSTLTSRVRAGTRYLRDAAGTWELGENLAWGSGSRATARATVRAWMRSSGHRHNILNRRFRDIGIGVAAGAPAAGEGDAATYTTDFGYRATR